MAQGTFKISINGNVNLMTALIAAGFKGTAHLDSLFIINENDVTLCVNLTLTANTPPVVPTDGTRIGNAETAIEYKLFSTWLDGGRVWLYSASAIDVKITVIGEGI